MPRSTPAARKLALLQVLLASCTTALQGGVAPIIDAIRFLCTERGRCTLAEIGDHLRVSGLDLPRGQKLSELVLQHADELVLSGPPNNRKVGLVVDSTEFAMLGVVRALLSKHGSMTTAELRRRLREQRSAIPGLVSLLQRHNDEFHVQQGAVYLKRREPTDALKSSSAERQTLPNPLVRMQSLKLPSTMHDIQNPEQLAEVVLIDMDNQAFLLESVAKRAEASSDVLVLVCCAKVHNPRLSQTAADCISDLAGRGLLRLLSPSRDGANAADFVLAFWAGWLHGRIPLSSRFLLLSSDDTLEQTVGDLLEGLGRIVVKGHGSSRNNGARHP